MISEEPSSSETVMTASGCNLLCQHGIQSPYSLFRNADLVQGTLWQLQVEELGEAKTIC